MICKDRGLGLGLLNDRDHADVLPLREVAARGNRGTLVRQEDNLVTILNKILSHSFKYKIISGQ